MTNSSLALGDVIKLASPSRAAGRKYPILSMTMHNGLMDQSEKFKKRVASDDTSAYKVVTRGQLVVGFPIDEGVLSFQFLYDEAIVSPAYDVWELRPERDVDRNYLQKFLRSPAALSFYKAKLKSTTARRRTIPRDTFLGLEVPLPSLEEQKRIAVILDQADELRGKRQRALNRLNQLGQAIFIEMFGNPDENDRGWPVVPVGDVAECIVPGRDKPKSFTGDVPWITTADISHLGLTGRAHAKASLSVEEIEKVRARVVPTNSVIMTCVGDLGKVSIAECPMVINQQLHSFQCGQELEPLYLMFILSHRKSWMVKMATQTTIPYMNKSTCNATPILLPPISLQKTFAERSVGLMGVRRFMLREELVFSDLFLALQHRAFRGELTASSLREAVA